MTILAVVCQRDLVSLCESQSPAFTPNELVDDSLLVQGHIPVHI